MAKENKNHDMPSGLETRTLNMVEGELRVSDGDETKIEGYTAKFNKWSADLGWFREKIDVGAFDQVLNDDVRALKNHDPNLILGRTKSKTLRLKADKVGLFYSADVPDTTTGADTVEEIRRGDISGNSFAFTVAEDKWNYDTEPIERTIIRVDQLFDVGPVVYPAYPDTTVAARSFDQFRSEHPPEPTEPEPVEPEPTEPEGDGTVVAKEPPTEEPPVEEPMTAERQAEIDRKYRTLGRISNQCGTANADS